MAGGSLLHGIPMPKRGLKKLLGKTEFEALDILLRKVQHIRSDLRRVSTSDVEPCDSTFRCQVRLWDPRAAATSSSSTQNEICLVPKPPITKPRFEKV